MTEKRYDKSSKWLIEHHGDGCSSLDAFRDRLREIAAG
jgi:hypothetical protein